MSSQINIDGNSTKCPLCNSKRTISLERHNIQRITKFYESHFKLDVKKFFPNDHFTTYLCSQCGLRHHHPAKPGDSDYYNHMQKFDFYYEKDKPEFSFAIKKLMELNPKSVLEIGCGEGNFLEKIKSAYSTKGAELTENSIKKMIEKGIELDNPEDRYDFVCSFQVLEHVPDAYEFLKMVVDKINPGGHLLITVPNNDSKYCTERFGALDYPPHHMLQWTKQSLYHIADLFPIEHVEYYEEQHRLTHYQGLIKGRRETINTATGIKLKISKAMSYFLDPILSPYFIDHINYSGMTHGMLFKKQI